MTYNNIFMDPKIVLKWLGVLVVAGVLALASAAGADSNGAGGFYLVSIGCGDPDHITLKALNVIKRSDIIFGEAEMRSKYPDLIEGKELHPRPSIKIHKYFQSLKGQFAQGAKVKNQDVDQASILKELNEFIRTVTDAVKAGKTVSLLDHGDPCIYGPYIWTMKALAAIDPVVIPGVSSLNAANAALRKGLTFGGAAHSAILTNAAGVKPGYDGADTIARLAATRASMVVFTMFADFEKLVPELSQTYPVETPVAIVAKAGYDEEQKVIRGTLGTIAQVVADEGPLPFEHLIYVGDFLEN